MVVILVAVGNKASSGLIGNHENHKPRTIPVQQQLGKRIPGKRLFLSGQPLRRTLSQRSVRLYPVCQRSFPPMSPIWGWFSKSPHTRTIHVTRCLEPPNYPHRMVKCSAHSSQNLRLGPKAIDPPVGALGLRITALLSCSPSAIIALV